MAKWDVALRTNKLLTAETMKAALPAPPKATSTAWDGTSTTTKVRYTATVTTAIGKASARCTTTISTDNHSVVLLSNRGHAIDLNAFWAKLRELIDAHANQ